MRSLTPQNQKYWKRTGKLRVSLVSKTIEIVLDDGDMTLLYWYFSFFGDGDRAR